MMKQESGAERSEVLMDSEAQRDKSWGVVGFYRIHGSGRELFGSDVANHDTIRLAIKHAVKHRDLGRDWTMGDDLICEVELSALQFAITTTKMVSMLLLVPEAAMLPHRITTQILPRSILTLPAALAPTQAKMANR